MVEQLFGSKTRVKLLHLFYSNPNRSFYVREITRKIDEQINSVRRELSNLLSIGIITSDTNNNRLYYEVNQEFNFYQPLSAIFGGGQGATAPSATPAPASTKVVPKEKQQVGEESDLVKNFRSLGRVDMVVLTGQFTRDTNSGIDLLIVGDVNQTKTAHFVSEFEEQEGKEIRYAVMLPADYNYRMQIKDRFIDNILAAKKQVLINDQDLRVQR